MWQPEPTSLVEGSTPQIAYLRKVVSYECPIIKVERLEKKNEIQNDLIYLRLRHVLLTLEKSVKETAVCR